MIHSRFNLNGATALSAAFVSLHGLQRDKCSTILFSSGRNTDPQFAEAAEQPAGAFVNVKTV